MKLKCGKSLSFKETLSFFIHSKEYGVISVGRQELTLVKVSPHNDRIFYHSKVFI